MTPDLLPDVVRVVPWVDAACDATGFGPASRYPEEVWLPRLGPSAFLLWRNLCRLLHAHPTGADADLRDLAAALGLGGSGGTSTLRRTIGRLEHFDAVAIASERVAVRHRLPKLTARQAASLPLHALAAHRALTAPVRKSG